MNKRTLLLSLFALNYCFSSLYAATFVSRGSGNWNAATTWRVGTDGYGVPGAGDIVTVASVHIITLNSATTVNTLTLNSGGTIQGGHSITILGNMTSNGGVLNPEGTVTIGGDLNWQGGRMGSATSNAVLDIVINGALNLSNTLAMYQCNLLLNGGGTWSTGDIALYNNSILEIPVGRTFTKIATTNPTNLNEYTGTANAVRIKGTFNITSSINVVAPFYNTGIVSVTGGILSLGGTGSSSGSFHSDAPRGIMFRYSPTYTLMEGTSFSGSGSIQVSKPVTATGASFVSTVASLVTSDYIFKIIGTFNHTGNLSVNGGMLETLGATTISGNFQINDGNIGSSTLPTVNNFVVQGSTTFENQVQLNRTRLILNGNGVCAMSQFYLNTNSVLEIPVGKTLTHTSGNLNVVTTSSGLLEVKGAFVNAGGTTNCYVPMTNDGTIETTGGVIGWFGGSTATGLFNSNVVNGIKFLRGIHTLQSGVQFNGTGSIVLGSEIRSIGGTFNSTVATLTLADGTFHFDGSFNQSGHLNMAGGVFIPIGVANIAGTFTWTDGHIGAIGQTTVINSNGDANIRGGILIGKKLCLNGNIIALSGLSLSQGGAVNICYAPEVVVTHPLCGQTTGSITVSTKTGLEYALNNSTNYQTSGIFNNLSPNNYTIRSRIIGSVYVSDVRQVTVNQPLMVVPSVNIISNPSNHSCAGTNVSFTATPNNAGTTPIYIWQKNGQNVGTNAPTYAAQDLVNGDIVTCIVTASTDVCANPTSATSNAITVTIFPNPVVNAGLDKTFCQNNISSITATATVGTQPFQFAWNSGQNTATITPLSDLGNQNYSVTVTDDNGCSSTDAVTILVVPTLTVTMTSDAIACSGATRLVSAAVTNGHGLLQYNWNTGSNQTAITVQPTVNTPYSVTVTDELGCSATANHLVTVQNCSNDSDEDGIADDADNCPNQANPTQLDSDCDGVGDICDVCPNVNDQIDNNNDGIPDCKQALPASRYVSAWRCANNKVWLNHKTGNNYRTLCVNQNALAEHLNHGDFVGTLIQCNPAAQALAISPDAHSDHDNSLECVVYPNPVHAEFIIEFKSAVTNPQIQIWDVLGQLVWSNTVERDNLLIINTFNWKNGLYFVKITDGQNVFQEKILKQ